MRSAYRLAFADGVAVGAGRLAVRKIADLILPTGRIVACDPLVFLDGARPYTIPVAPGTYPVYAALLDDQHQLVSVRFAEREPASWLRAGTRPVSSGEEGYPVDAGTGCFCDVVAKGALAGAHDLLDRMNAAGYDGGRSGALVVDAASGANLVFFRSGAGDGVYASWFGFDADGEPVCLVTDFAGSHLDDVARGGPDEAEPAEELTELWRYIVDHGAPSEAWIADRLPDRDLGAAWLISPDGPTLRDVLEATAHPQLGEVLRHEIELRAAVYEDLDIPELAAPLREIGARLGSGALAAADAAHEVNRHEAHAETAVRKRHPRRTSQEAMEAALRKLAPVEAYERVRTARRSRDRKLAQAIRAIVPGAPTIEELVAGAARG